ncbi:MAG: prepilin-type N-terminal cleavage/methylation domain-containing protein [Armatimonadota bacterium]
MHVKLNQNGHTLIELLVAMSITGLICAGAFAMMISSMSCFDGTSTQTYTDIDAVMAMQMIVNDVREAKSINIIANGKRLRVIFPVKLSEGYYDRHQADMANQIDYYLSDETGVPGHSGNWLWRGKNNNNRTPLKRNVNSLEFEQDTSRSVKITVTTLENSASGPKTTSLTQRVVYLRNY